MRSQLASLDFHYLINELKTIEGSRVDRIYNHGKDELYLQFHKMNLGKIILRVIVGKVLFLAKDKKIDESPSGFCLGLRKQLEGKFLDKLDQIEPERILKFEFRSKDEKKIIYIEFFGKGNVVLCDEDDIILSCLFHHEFKDRKITPKERYKFPKMKYNIFKIKKTQIAELLKKSKKDKLVTSLAVGLGVGGIYSEELCLKSKIDKNSSPSKSNDKDFASITSSLKKMVGMDLNPVIVFKEGEAIDFSPVGLESYKELKTKKFKNFNEAVMEYFSNELKLEKKSESAYEKQIEELKRIIDEQKSTISEMETKEEDNRIKGELIYEKYSLIKDILEEVNKANEKHPWKDIKEKLKGHKIIKDLDVKDKRITLKIE